MYSRGVCARDSQFRGREFELWEALSPSSFFSAIGRSDWHFSIRAESVCLTYGKLFVGGKRVVPVQKHGGGCSSTDEILSRKREANIRSRMNTLSKRWGQYMSGERRTNTLSKTWRKIFAHERIPPIRRMDVVGIRQIYSYSSGVCRVGTDVLQKVVDSGQKTAHRDLRSANTVFP